MSAALLDLSLFTAKTVILLFFILLLLVAFISLLSKGKNKLKGRLVIKDLNKKLEENTEFILSETLNKRDFKHYLKNQKKTYKAKEKSQTKPKTVYVLNFHGDIKASAVESLREEVNAVLTVIRPKDEIVVRLESSGGVVHGYGLAAAQLMRIRQKKIPLTIAIDKVAASGGYMMAAIGSKILAAPFAIIGSIGVIIQLPNFHRLLKEKNIDFEQLTAGEFKRTITLFGKNTPEGIEKLQQEIEEVHTLFKGLITEYRPQLDIQKVATGEHWLGQQALNLKLVDEIKTSDEYLFEKSKDAQVFEISYEIKKPFLAKFSNASSLL